MSLVDELRELLEKVVERAVRRVLREEVPAGGSPGPWISTAKLSKEFGISQGTIRRWIRERKLRHLKVGRGLRVHRGDFESNLSMPRDTDEHTHSPEHLADLDDERQRRPKRV